MCVCVCVCVCGVCVCVCGVCVWCVCVVCVCGVCVCVWCVCDRSDIQRFKIWFLLGQIYSHTYEPITTRESIIIIIVTCDILCHRC